VKQAVLALIEAARSRSYQAGNSELSARENQIARLLVAGYAVVNAAAVMGLSENTVRTYVRRIYQKPLVKSRAELISAYASAAAAS
jgi:DNA-binding NarL/FixJ family response regulator